MAMKLNFDLLIKLQTALRFSLAPLCLRCSVSGSRTMAGAACASPFCTWIVAAACMSSSPSPATACSDQTRRAVRKRGAGPGRTRCFPAAAIASGGLCGSGIHSLLGSYLAFEPCPDFFRSCAVDGSLSSLFGLWKADVHRRRPRRSAASGSQPPRRAIVCLTSSPLFLIYLLHVVSLF